MDAADGDEACSAGYVLVSAAMDVLVGVTAVHVSDVVENAHAYCTVSSSALGAGSVHVSVSALTSVPMPMGVTVSVSITMGVTGSCVAAVSASIHILVSFTAHVSRVTHVMGVDAVSAAT